MVLTLIATQATMTYERAVKAYHAGDFEKAAEYFRNNMQIEDSESYLEKCEIMISAQGGWLSRAYDEKLIISGWNVRLQKFNWRSLEINTGSFLIQPQDVTDKGFLTIYDGLEREYEYKMPDEIIASNSIDKWRHSRSNSADYYVPEIGMTAQQVLDSAFEEPDRKNTTKTANSTFEQWGYDIIGTKVTCIYT